jgi:hypothetical protein
MAEYIEREAINRICFMDYFLVDGEVRTESVALVRDIEKLPAADVAPVVHGRWAHIGGDEWCCPVCGFVITTEGNWDKPTKKYCEDCGAKMDGGMSE